MDTTQVYQVATEGDCEGRFMKTLGYATGYPDDIKAFYNDQRMYRIQLTPIQVTPINPEMVREKRVLLEERATLRKRLGELENILGR